MSFSWGPSPVEKIVSASSSGGESAAVAIDAPVKLSSTEVPMLAPAPAPAPAPARSCTPASGPPPMNPSTRASDSDIKRRQRVEALDHIISESAQVDSVELSTSEVLARGSDPVPDFATVSTVAEHVKGADDKAQSSATVSPVAAIQQAKSFRERGNNAFRAGRSEEAIVLYGMGITTLSGISHDRLSAEGETEDKLGGLPQLFANRAAAMIKSERLSDALDDLDRAVELFPAYAKAHYRRGTVLESMGRDTEAMTAFSCAKRIEPTCKMICMAHRNLQRRLLKADTARASSAAQHNATTSDNEQGMFNWGKAPDSVPASAQSSPPKAQVSTATAPIVPGDEDASWELIDQFAFSDEMQKVKVYVDLPGVGELPQNRVTCSFGLKSLDLRIRGYSRKIGEFANLRLHCIELWDEIEPNACKLRVKPNKIAITLTKGACANDRPWEKLRAS